MKKTHLLLSVFSVLLLSCSSSGNTSTTSEATSSTSQDTPAQKINIFPKHTRGSGCVGDPMPYYENGKMYVFYLEDARNYGGGGYHPISLLETSDLVHYEDKGIMLDFVDNRYSIEFALATGSVVKDKSGLYHFFYGGYNDNLNFTGLPYAQTILHATSSDLYHWTKDPTFNGTGYIIGQDNDFRDPYVFYMDSDSKYWMLVTSREGGTSTVIKYTSTDLLNWTKEGAFFKNGRFNNMECSSLIRYKDYWLYSFSENGEHGYTRFFSKKNLTDPEWIEVPALDGFYAGRPVIGQDNRLFLYGWAPTKGLYDSVKPDWAGNLTMHELDVDKDGMVYPIFAKEFKNAIVTEKAYKEVMTGNVVDSFTFNSAAYESKAIWHLDDKKTNRMSFDFTPSMLKGRCGLTFGNVGDNELGNIAFDLNIERNQFLFYNNCKAPATFNSPEYFVNFEFKANQTYHVDFVYEDGVSQFYLNNQVALSMRTASIARNNWAFYGQNAGVSFNNVKIYEA